MDITPPGAPRLFLVDGYALIYRAFFALIARPLTTSRGENTSAAWGIVNFLERLIEKHRPDYLGWVHDSGLSFRHERYPEYKQTREKLTDELQADFDSGMERIAALLEAYRIPILTLDGYEADDVIGTLAKRASSMGLNVVIVSGDKDFQQLVGERTWLLNPGRGGPAAVDEQWVGAENGAERLGVPPERTIDYLALVGDSSDNVPGVRGIGEKTARGLIEEYGDLDRILAAAPDIKGKRAREALLAYADLAHLSRELVTIRTDLDMPFDLERMRLQPKDTNRLRALLLELEFTSLAKSLGDEPGPVAELEGTRTYTTVDTIPALERLCERIRDTGRFAFDTETILEPGAAGEIDPLRSILVSIAIAVTPGEAYYLPFAHREWTPPQGELLPEPPRTVPPDEDTGAGAQGARSSARTARKKADAMSIAARRIAAGTSPVRNLPPLDDPSLTPLRALLADGAIAKTAQHAKYDMLVLRRAGVDVQGLEFDTMLASYLLDPGRRSHGLDTLALEFLEYRMTSYEALCGKGRSAIPFDAVPVDAARDYSCEDADITLRLREVFEPQLVQYNLLALLHRIEVPLISVLMEMEWTGISIDLAWFAALKERFQRERERVEEEIYAEAGERFNINSNPQLRVIMFEKLQLPVRKRTATGASTDASVLQELAEQGHRLPELLLEYRELFKLEGTYLDALPRLVNPHTGRLHTSFNQTVAATGRLSSSDPNLQNIPIRSELGRDIRRGFVPREGWLMLAADYSQIELRLLAHLSHDPAFVQAFRSGGDIHRQTASVIFGVPIEEVTGEMRARAKTINFATIYGQGANALARQLRISNEEAKAFIETYFERFHGVRTYLDSMVAMAREHGYVETIFNRRRYITELRDRNFNIRAFGERVATNAPIQGSAADLIKVAMIRIQHALVERGLASRMLLQVHDELVFEAPPAEVDELSALVRREMEGAADLDVPLVVSMGTGPNWLESKGL